MPPSSSNDPIGAGVEPAPVDLPGDWTPRQVRLMVRIIRRVREGDRIWLVLTARGWWVLVLPLLILAGCAGNATPQVVREEVPVTVVVERTVEVTRELTRVITATPTPRPTATPAPTATPTPAVVVPAGWITYTHPAGLFTVALPAGTKIRDEGDVLSTFELATGSRVILGVDEGTAGVIGNEQDIDAVVQTALNIQSDLDTVRVLDRGSWTVPGPANYAELAVTDYVSEVTTYRVLARAPLGAASRATMLVLLRHRATEAEKAQLGTILATLHAGR